MPATINPTTKAGFLVQMDGLDTYWETFSGVDDKAQTSEWSDGLSNRVYKLIGPRNASDVTLGKAFDPENDKAIVDWYLNFCDGVTEAKTISVTPVRYCPEPEPRGSALTFYGVKPSGLKGFEADKKSNDVSTLELTCIVDSWEYN
jgi:hypothetical protein